MSVDLNPNEVKRQQARQKLAATITDIEITPEGDQFRCRLILDKGQIVRNLDEAEPNESPLFSAFKAMVRESENLDKKAILDDARWGVTSEQSRIPSLSVRLPDAAAAERFKQFFNSARSALPNLPSQG